MTSSGCFAFSPCNEDHHSYHKLKLSSGSPVGIPLSPQSSMAQVRVHLHAQVLAQEERAQDSTYEEDCPTPPLTPQPHERGNRHYRLYLNFRAFAFRRPSPTTVFRLPLTNAFFSIAPTNAAMPTLSLWALRKEQKERDPAHCPRTLSTLS